MSVLSSESRSKTCFDYAESRKTTKFIEPFLITLLISLNNKKMFVGFHKESILQTSFLLFLSLG